MADLGILTLAGLGVTLGLRHGIDWDHIAAITDITSATVTTDETARSQAVSPRPVGMARQANAFALATSGGLDGARLAGVDYRAATTSAHEPQRRREAWHGFFLATMYALGHASLVVALGLLAIWFGRLLPAWIDPFMERIIGLTLIF